MTVKEYDWMGKLIYLELRKWVRYYYADKWYINKPETVQENKTHKFLWDFEIQKDQSIPARKRDQELINKNKTTCHLVNIWTLSENIKYHGTWRIYSYKF